MFEVSFVEFFQRSLKLHPDWTVRGVRQDELAISMYLWDAFAAAARTVLPQAAIVHDKYHLERLNQRAIDLTRRQELPEIPELKGKRFWLLRSSATRPPEHQAFFDAIHQSISTTARPGRLPKTSEQSINSRLPLMLDPGDVQTSV